MCIRFSLVSPLDRLAESFGARTAPDLKSRYRPSPDIPPDRNILGIVDDHADRAIDTYRWGLIPSWTRRIPNHTFNAKAESITTKTMFKQTFTQQRLLIPADAFYAWYHPSRNVHKPYAFRRADGTTIAFAGLWEVWRDREKDTWIRSCTVITTEASPDMAGLVARMPVILEPGTFDHWLDPELHDPDELMTMLRPAPTGTLIHARARFR